MPQANLVLENSLVMLKEKKAQGLQIQYGQILYAVFVHGGSGVNAGFQTCLGQELSILQLFSCSHLGRNEDIQN